MADNKKRIYYNRRRPQRAQDDYTPLYDATLLDLTLEDLGVSEDTRALLDKNNIKTAADLCRRSERDMFRIQSLNKKVLFELKDSLGAKGMAFKPEPEKTSAQGDAKDAPQSGAKPQRAQNAPKQNAPKRQNSNAEQPTSTDEPRRSRFVTAAAERSSSDSDNRVQGGNQRAAGNRERRDNQRDNRDVRDSRGNRNDRDNRDQRNDRNRSSQRPEPAPKPEKLTEPLPVEQWRKIQKGGKWGFYDGFKTVIPCAYDEIFFFRDGLASVEMEEKCGYIDKDNNLVIPCEYDTAMSFSEGLASVCRGDKCGYIDKEGTLVIPFEYDAATPFENGEAKIKKDGKWGTITPDGAVKWIN